MALSKSEVLRMQYDTNREVLTISQSKKKIEVRLPYKEAIEAFAVKCFPWDMFEVNGRIFVKNKPENGDIKYAN